MSRVIRKVALLERVINYIVEADFGIAFANASAERDVITDSDHLLETANIALSRLEFVECLAHAIPRKLVLSIDERFERFATSL